MAAARQLAGLDADAQVTWLQREQSPMDRFLAGMGGSALFHGMRSQGLFLPASWLPASTRDELLQLRELLRQRDGRSWAIHAHCQCDVY